MADKKVLDYDGLLYYHGKLKTLFPTAVSWDSTNSKITITKNGTASDVVTAATLKTAMGLNNVGNFKAVSTEASQGLTDEEKANARSNIGAGDSAFSGSFADLTNVPTTISGYGITDASISSGTITLGSNTFKGVSVAANQGLTDTEKSNARSNIGAGTSNFDGTFGSLSGAPTTLSGYGITDASISSGTITLGSNTFKGVSVAANQGLTATEKENARANLGITITELYKFKGTVATVAALDNIQNPSVGDVYNVTANGKNYAWTGTEWDDLGGEFTITSITNAEIDAILAS